MADTIPNCLSDAFKQAIAVCQDWSGDNRERLAVAIVWDPNQEPDPQHPVTLCGLVSTFSDDMPGDIVASLLRLPYNVCDSVGSDLSYAKGARCLLQFIKLKQEMHDRNR
jgi:hypothetical protein